MKNDWLTPEKRTAYICDEIGTLSLLSDADTEILRLRKTNEQLHENFSDAQRANETWQARVRELEAIVEHCATDGAEVTPELQAVARRLLEGK